MKLYSFPYSSNARKARVTALLLGIDLELVNVDLGKGDQRKPEFLAINPMGRVPVLDDSGFILWESHAIMAYLADKKPGNTLYPAAAQPRADVNRWLFWAANHWGPAVAALVFENLLKARFNLGPPEPVQVKRQEDFVRTFGGVLDGHLAKRQWVCGSAVTLADMALAASLMNAGPAKIPVQSFAHVQTWLARVKGLDAWKQTEPPPLG
ncbi:MAG: glutathione S-transferase family protein [SAR324 cluster bacterium]